MPKQELVNGPTPEILTLEEVLGEEDGTLVKNAVSKDIFIVDSTDGRIICLWSKMLILFDYTPEHYYLNHQFYKLPPDEKLVLSNES